MSGKTFSLGLGIFCLLFGLTLFYFQVFAFYTRVSNLDHIKFDGVIIPVSNYRGIDSASSALKLRGCFNVDPRLFLNKPIAKNPTPLAAPFWFDCFDYEYLSNKIDSESVKVYVAKLNEYDGIDRVVMVFETGEAYQWRQLNSKYSGK